MLTGMPPFFHREWLGKTHCWLVGNEGVRYPISPYIYPLGIMYPPVLYPLRDYIGYLIPSFPTNQQGENASEVVGLAGLGDVEWYRILDPQSQ